MSNSTDLITVHRVFNLVSACCDAIALSICLSFLSIIAYRLLRAHRRRGQVSISVPLILSINILCNISVKSILQIVHVTLPTIQRDFQMHVEVRETFGCRFRSYLLWALIGLLYWGYVLLAFFRFARVIYPRQLWLHRPSLYLFGLIPGHVVIILIVLLPLLLAADGVHLLPGEGYCSMLVQPAYYLIYHSTIGFFIPYSILCMFYLWIGRQTRLSSARAFQERNRRDYIVMRRMLLNAFVLSAVTVPYFIIYVIDTIHNRFDPIIYRVQWLSSSLSSCLFALLLPLITTQIRDYLKVNRLAPRIHHM